MAPTEGTRCSNGVLCDARVLMRDVEAGSDVRGDCDLGEREEMER